MKKALSFVLALVLCLSVGAVAFAEAEDGTIYTEATYEGTWLGFQDGAFMLYLPSDWNVLELTEDVIASGVMLIVSQPDGALSMAVQASDYEGDYTIESLMAEFEAAEGMSGVGTFTVNDVPFVYYNVEEKNTTGMVALDAEAKRFYNIAFVMSDLSDEASLNTILEIIGTLSPYEADEEAA